MTGRTLSACICTATFAFIIVPEAASAYAGPGSLPVLGTMVAFGIGVAILRIAGAKARRG